MVTVGRRMETDESFTVEKASVVWQWRVLRTAPDQCMQAITQR